MERLTRQRDAIHTVLAEAGRPLTPQELLDAARSHVAGIGIATVYRNLKAMVEAGEIVAVPLPGEAPRYELAGSEHHHHFYCRACDRVFEVHGCPGDMKRLAPRGFQVQAHELMLYGLCADCACGAQSAAAVPT
ncbi:Fur family transcriptional regulator [Cupriavidus sp. AU9028]|uniref:Fur family transcriptional regulator n=1 Tax=Cupriavidus sp. AU9028 TaxID=2871157 RepID=UPI001C98D91C|nr:transcriptional repressor [Cupriavidus sp. AU9028]MBY4899227.1 transcriptional repressor [Cupriavidus sp. AU9028]